MTPPSRSGSVPPLILFVITAGTGVVDAVSFLALGHVFTANMTGNIVFLGFATAGASGVSFPRSAIALLAFVLGAAAGGRMAFQMSSRPAHHWASRAFGVDALFLLAAAAASLGLAQGQDSMQLFVVIAFTGVAMGFRNATVLRVAMPDLTTTVLTRTITGLVADSSLAGGTNPRWQRRIASILLMFAGAAAGGFMLKYSVALPLFVCGLGSGASALMVLARGPGSR
jgi:uncharacterized membrane protein YoaK (UPF0700 family)